MPESTEHLLAWIREQEGINREIAADLSAMRETIEVMSSHIVSLEAQLSALTARVNKMKESVDA